MIPATCGFRVGPDASDVNQRYFETALNAQSLSAPRTCSVSLPLAIDKSTKARLLWSPHLAYNRDIEFRIILLYVSRTALLVELLDH